MRLASMDIGTNSVKLLVAEVEDQQIKKILLDYLVITRLGEGIEKNHEILPEAMDRTLQVISDFQNRAKQLGVEDTIAISTSAMREAKNRDVFIQKVMDQTGVNLRVITGDEEAEIAFMGVCSDSELQSKNAIIVDVGGGSTEFVIGQGGIIENKFSVNIGCVRLTEEFIHSDPVNPADLQTIIQHVISALYTHLSKISAADRDLIGIGGTMTTIASIHQNMEGYALSDIHKYILQKDQVFRVLTHLRRMTLEERRNVPGLSPQRADVIVAGIAIFSTIMEILRIQEIVVSARGLRYGAILLKAKHLSIN
ncbi:MAG: Ppx/GppA family phosphatase [Candidatus Poribacteria bacterium]|nr:Ppx/GppA family phosphatase [Candidatus Poribacteria bacterium]